MSRSWRCWPAGCGPSIDVAAALRLESVSTGWVDVGPVGSSNKLVPAVEFTIKNASDRTLAPVQVNAVFRRVGESSEWSNGTVTAAGSSGSRRPRRPIASSSRAAPATPGPTGGGTCSSNSEFVDATVDVFARYGSRQWTRVGEYRIARQIIER